MSAIAGWTQWKMIYKDRLMIEFHGTDSGGYEIISIMVQSIDGSLTCENIRLGTFNRVPEDWDDLMLVLTYADDSTKSFFDYNVMRYLDNE